MGRLSLLYLHGVGTYRGIAQEREGFRCEAFPFKFSGDNDG